MAAYETEVTGDLASNSLGPLELANLESNLSESSPLSSSSSATKVVRTELGAERKRRRPDPEEGV